MICLRDSLQQSLATKIRYVDNVNNRTCLKKDIIMWYVFFFDLFCIKRLYAAQNVSKINKYKNTAKLQNIAWAHIANLNAGRCFELLRKNSNNIQWNDTGFSATKLNN